MGLLEGKVAIITGAGQGIGRGHALLFAKEGAKVVVNDLGGSREGHGSDAALADKVVAEIQEAGGEATANYDSVADPEGAQNIIDTAVNTYGKLDILLNNAGVLRDKTLKKMTDEIWQLVIDVHLTGTFLTTRAAARHMIERNEGGRIINTSSVSGLMGNFGQTNYAAAKAGIYGLTRTAALELKKYNVTVNALAPVALTRMTSDLPVMQAMSSAEEMLAPDLIAPGALFLASDMAGDITGEVLAVEGKRVFLFRMTQTEPCLPNGADGWTAQELRERWAEISGKK